MPPPDVDLYNFSFVDEGYHARCFSALVRAQTKKFSNELEAICCTCYDAISSLADQHPIQDSCAIRNTLRTRALAHYLIDDEGKLRQDQLAACERYLQQSLFCLGPQRQADVVRQQQILQVIRHLQKDRECVRLLLSIDQPQSNPLGEQIIRHTLNLGQKVPMQAVIARRAILAAWMAYLRQSVGSCFATAPAIVVHDEQPHLLLKDLAELLATTRLKRTFGGIEYAAPMCPSAGSGDLKKMTEFTREQVFELQKVPLLPGYVAALAYAEIIDGSASFNDQLQQLHALLLPLLQTAFSETENSLWISVEDLLRKLVLRYLHLEEKDLMFQKKEEYSAFKLAAMAPVGVGILEKERAKGLKGAAVQNFSPLYMRACLGFKNLAENALLKVWEFTVASFAETKPSFSKWNLYASLGLDSRERGGIGSCFFRGISEEFEQVKAQLAQVRERYDLVVMRINQLASRLRSADSETEARWMKGEYQAQQVELYNLQQVYDDQRSSAEELSNLFDMLMDKYEELFPRYFQEVYDPDIREVQVGLYDDSPAGFHLVYKHGRENSIHWTRVGSADEFTHYLADFFVATENLVSAECELSKNSSRLLTRLITAIVNHVKTDEFLESALQRMAAAHRVPLIAHPLKNIDKVQKKPWVYISGGTMSSLVSCYFRREDPPTQTGRWVESPFELLIFLTDTMKMLPPELSKLFIENPRRAMLMHSPTHAFLFKPGCSSFLPCWQANEYTYTWLRDNVVLPKERFISFIELDEAMMWHIVEKLKSMIPSDYRHYFGKTFGHFYGVMTPPPIS